MSSERIKFSGFYEASTVKCLACGGTGKEIKLRINSKEEDKICTYCQGEGKKLITDSHSELI